ncbi:MAG: MerR family DNA-binding transcriptional regulator [Methylobacteriaceae bacterium]|jgi:DNA-binding transcriptional MerR regulator|nr:MerR family DNA-binding transcriptional regulator [Methylobacteriaceae bacterium]
MSADEQDVKFEKIYSQLPGSQAGDETYLIGDLAREFNVSLRTLRFYEDRGLLSPKRNGLTRIYSSRDRARFALILKGKQLGFTLSEIQAMVEEEEGSDSRRANLSLSLSQIDEQIAYLEKQKADITAALDELQTRRRELLQSG